jgi:pilus assembly protein Flp/PilA
VEGKEMQKIRQFFKDESGASLVEYALLVALIAVASIAAINLLSTQISTTFNNAQSSMATSS